jgi:hypothetical protein
VAQAVGDPSANPCIQTPVPPKKKKKKGKYDPYKEIRAINKL